MNMRRTRIAIAIVFAVHGTTSGSFAARLAAMKDHLDIGAGPLGAALVAQAVGAFIAMLAASRVIHKYGERGAVRISLVVVLAVLILPPLMPNVYTFAVAVLAMGAANGLVTISLNAQAVQAERAAGRSIMTGLHGMWSVGNLAGAGLGALAVVAGMDTRLHFALLAAVLVPVAIISSNALPFAESSAGQAGQTAPPPPPRFAIPAKAVVVIGLVGFCSSFIEGASHNWTAIYIEQVTKSTAALAAFGYVAFVAAMAAARLVGDFVVRRVGPVVTVRTGASLTALGALLVAVANHPALSVLGFVCIGTGTAVTIPLAAAAGGRVGATPALGVAGVMTITFTAGLIAPGTVGGIADLTSLRVSFAVVTVIAVAMAFLAKALGKEAKVAAEPVTAAA